MTARIVIEWVCDAPGCRIACVQPLAGQALQAAAATIETPGWLAEANVAPKGWTWVAGQLCCPWHAPKENL
jgi:hypothetical protein